MKENPQSLCLACSGSLKLFGPRGGYEYFICETCKSLQLYPQPDQEHLSQRYSEEYGEGLHGATMSNPARWNKVVRNQNLSLVSVLKDYSVSGPVLDYGAGWGGLCNILQMEGYETYGVELSKQMADYGEVCGLPIIQGDLSAVQHLRGSLSALVMSAVFEHLIDHDKWLSDIGAFLKTDGYFVTLQPTASAYHLLGDLFRFWRRENELPELMGGFAPPWHTVLFSISGMKTLAARHSFDVVEVRPAPQGRLGGVLSGVQVCLEQLNKAGWALGREKWPLVLAHIFVLRKTGS